MICIYHSKDLDGWMSAAIVKLKHPEAKLIGWNYGDPIPDIPFDEDGVILVDISFPLGVMESLYFDAEKLIYIDHHQRAITEIEERLGSALHGLRNAKFAACELTWRYLFPEQRMPELVRLLGRYDCFGHKGTEEEMKVLHFQYGARQVIDSPDLAYAYLMEYLDNDYKAQAQISGIQYAGEAIYRYLCVEAKQKYAQKFDIRFVEPLHVNVDICRTFACVNAERFNPVNFGIDYHKDGYDGFACFWYENRNWNFSLYNDNGEVDCSLIAKQFGGGGHKGASGFRTKDLYGILIKIGG